MLRLSIRLSPLHLYIIRKLLKNHHKVIQYKNILLIKGADMPSNPLLEKQVSVVAIPSDTFLTDSIVDFPIYYQLRDHQYRQILKEGSHFSSHLKEQLEGKGVKNLYIRDSDKNKYEEYMQQKWLHETIAGMKQVGVRNFKADTTVEFPLYYRKKNTLKQVLEKGKVLESSQLKMLEEEKVKKLLINNEDRKYFKTYVQQNTPPFTLEAGLSLKEKAERIFAHGEEIMDYLATDPRSDWGYARVKVIVEHMVELVLEDEKAFKTLNDVGDKEYELGSHSLSVALFSIGFGQHLGFDRDDLRRIGYCAMFHDIGKSQIDEEIMDKAGGLKREEFEIVKKHAKYGSFIMRSHLEKDKDILDGILYHHEHFDGSGYPDQLKGHAIPLFAQIVALSDVYDAISRKKPYGDPHNSFEALNIMMKEMANQFDKKLLIEFVRFMGPQYRD